MFQVLNDMLSIMGWKFEADVEIDDSNSNVLEDDKSYQSMVLSHKNCIYCKSVVFELELKINFQTSEYTSFIQLSLTTHLDHEKKISFRSCDFLLQNLQFIRSRLQIFVSPQLNIISYIRESSCSVWWPENLRI